MWVDRTPFHLIRNATWNLSAIAGPVNIKFSPNLSKVYIDFLNGNDQLTAIVRAINFETGMISNITFLNQTRYLRTIASLSRNLRSHNFYLGDNYLVVRNDSY